MADTGGNPEQPPTTIPLGPRPLAVVMGAAMDTDGKHWVTIALSDGNASFAGFLDPDRAENVSRALSALAVRARSGLIVPPSYSNGHDPEGG